MLSLSIHFFYNKNIATQGKAVHRIDLGHGKVHLSAPFGHTAFFFNSVPLLVGGVLGRNRKYVTFSKDLLNILDGGGGVGGTERHITVCTASFIINHTLSNLTLCNILSLLLPFSHSSSLHTSPLFPLVSYLPSLLSL